MNKEYVEGLLELNKAKEESSAGQSQKLRERVAAILRTFGDSDMKATFNRLTVFKAETSEDKRYEKTVAALDVMMDEFRLKYNKALLSKDAPGTMTKNHVDLNPKGGLLRSSSIVWVVVPILLTVIGGAYLFGYDRGYVRFDKEKIELQKTIDLLNERVKELEGQENAQLKTR
jgi:hypothetical protein